MQGGAFIRQEITFKITAILKWMAYYIISDMCLRGEKWGSQGQEGHWDNVRDSAAEMDNHIQFLRAYLSVLIFSYFLKKVSEYKNQQ